MRNGPQDGKREDPGDEVANMDVINGELSVQVWRPFIKNEHNGIRFHHVIQEEDDGLLWEMDTDLTHAQ